MYLEPNSVSPLVFKKKTQYMEPDNSGLIDKNHDQDFKVKLKYSINMLWLAEIQHQYVMTCWDKNASVCK